MKAHGRMTELKGSVFTSTLMELYILENGMMISIREEELNFGLIKQNSWETIIKVKSMEKALFIQIGESIMVTLRIMK